MNIVCLDFEGVLVPEIWIGLAERTGIEELKVTTRDITDYDELMSYRLDLMKKHGLRFRDIQVAANSLEPLKGAPVFLAWLRTHFQVAILSDTFYELSGPLVRKLGDPMILCHRLEVDGKGRITGYHLRQADPKRAAVKGFKSMNYTIAAAGDSYNDISMLQEADFGVLFQPPISVVRDYPEFKVSNSYTELKEILSTFDSR
ncbi:MAG TPA: bifunctional phosphoserine phosphatase/homoserine phosphotransferase ThrH [Gammaproteobacteria bacterium]|nr:bifunctional phosphoserine phosphatase/homoserine phosphotransferase ThrH [Gammaproteobacteria bacterium]|tara:strand:- start:215 stop:820 length:606 start_codon:yes stop_codon:yes gene_type:complete